MKCSTLLSFLLALVCCAAPASAQFGGLRGIVKSPKQIVNEKLSQTTGAYNRSQNMIAYLTIATDQGMKALDELAKAFPPGKVAAFKKLSAQYHEASAKRQNGDIDSDSITVASDAAAEMAQLEGDWKTYQKESGRDVRHAHARISLMLIADGEASTKAPQMLAGLEADMKVVATKHDTDMLNRMQNSATLLKTVIAQAPKQQQSFSAVQRVTKNIADAEHFALPPDPSPESLTTAPEMTSAAEKIDADI